MIIDATNLIVGRLATTVAKKALLGESMTVVNCRNAVITGKRSRLLNDFQHKRKRGIPAKGPFYPKNSQAIVRRSIRGMLPYKKDKGRAAFKRVMCYSGVPKEFEGKKLETLQNANVSKMQNLRFMKIGDLTKALGGRQ